MNYWEPFGNIRDKKRGRMKRGGDFCFVWNLLVFWARELHLCNQKNIFLFSEPINLLLKDIHVVNNIPIPPFFFSFLPYLPLCSQ
jgi:hypothetical protein